MGKRIIWLTIGCLVALALTVTACSPTATPSSTPTPPATPSAPVSPTAPSTPTVEKPQQDTSPQSTSPIYGGTLVLAQAADQLNWDPVRNITGVTIGSLYETGWAGDWTRGSAGGYGTNETDWGFANNDLFSLKDGRILQSWEWNLDAAKNEGTIVYQIRPDVHFHAKDAAAAKLANGRAITADDVVAVYKRATTIGADGFIWRGNAELRNVPISKTGEMEVTINVPSTALINAITRFGDALFFYPPEIIQKYGDMQDWKNSVGTGSFMLQDFVPGSQIKLIKNPNYWMKDPVGPGKGNSLPYIDAINILVIPDSSTRLAAVRTGKVDQMSPVSREDALQLRKTTGLSELVGTSWQGRGTPLMMRTDKAPFNDIRVRKAMTMAIDFQMILANLYGGEGQIITYPFSRVKGYEALHVGLDDPDFPEAAKELYSHNTEKAKLLLAEAGYPNGFKTTLLLSSTETAEIDYYSIVKDMWAKIGIELAFDLKDAGAATTVRNSRSHEALATNTTGPVAVFQVGNPVTGQSAFNLSMLNDPVINEAMTKVRLAAITSQSEAMTIFREEIFKHTLVQAYAIPNVIGTFHVFWWPWVKNYSGEITVGYDDITWPTWAWIDQPLKKSMGY